MIIPVALVINVFMEILPIETFIQSKYIWLDENKMNTKDGIVAGSYPTFMPRISATYGPENFPLVLKEVGEPFSTEEFLDWLKENLGEVERFLSIHGAVLFRGFSQALNTARSFERASLILEPNLEDEYLGTSPRTLVEGCKFVHTASEFPGWRIIPAHCEMSFLPNPPNRIFFYAHHPNEGDGGETPLVDYRQVLRDMDPEVLNRFKTKKIRYIRHYYDETDEFPASLDPFTTKSWQSMFYTHDTEVVKQKCKDQGFVATWTKQTEDGTPYGTLKLDHVMDATRINPKTGDEIWHNHMNVLHITAHTAEHAFSAQYLRSWEQLAYHYAFEAYVVVMRFWLGDERLGQQTTHEGAEPMLESDVDHMRQMTWKNTRLEKHQKGDLVMLDNYRVAHARQPYSGDRSILTTWA